VTYNNYINLEKGELDKSIYRIMPTYRFFQCFNEKKLVLVTPSKWDDPFENYLLSAKIKNTSDGSYGDMSGIRDKVFGQCWTQHRETDAMWRIYSADTNGVKVRTTPRKLLQALKKSLGPSADITGFIGKVQYKTQKELVFSLENIELFNSNGSGIAESLLYKRKEFSHEKEIRLISTEGNNFIYSFNIDPYSLFEEVVFDPRMDKYLYEVYRNDLKTKKFTGRIARSALYKPPKELLIKI